MSMNIAIIIRFLTRTGGAVREAFMLARELEKRGHRATIYTFAYDPHQCFPGEFSDIRIKVLQWDYPQWWSRFFRIPIFGTTLQRFLENRKAVQLARLIDPATDVLNPHDQTSAHTAYYFKKLVGPAPSVWMMNDLHIRRWSIFDHPLLKPPRRSRIKKIVDWLRDWRENQKFFSAQDKIGVIVQSMAERAKIYLGRPDAAVVRSGADLERFLYRARNPILNKRIRICSQGIFYTYRRFEDVIEAVKILADQGYDPFLTIVGDYGHKDTARAYHQNLVSLVKKLGIEPRVRFAGVVSEDELNRVYYESDVFVFASIQTWGIAIFEAMATGLPVVLSRDAGAGEMLRDGETMMLARTGDPADIARAVRTLADDPLLRARMADRANQFVRSHISWTRYADAMLQLFERAVAESRQPRGAETRASAARF